MIIIVDYFIFETKRWCGRVGKAIALDAEDDGFKSQPKYNTFR